MLLDILFLVVGGFLLYLGAEWLVKGSAGLAYSFRVQPVVIGLTVVAYGTSTPELIVTLIAAINGHSGIALGNIIGSNIANIGLILGLTALISPPRVESKLIRRELPILLIASFLALAMLWDDVISRIEGAILFVGAIAFTLYTLKATRQLNSTSSLNTATRDEMEFEVGRGSRAKLIILSMSGLGLLLVGGKVFVYGATTLALDLGISERLVGLTIVAVGTSLPELAASLVAALRGHSELAIGNIVGSNIFNILFVLGCSSLVSPIAESFTANWIDFSMFIGITILGTLMMRGERIISRLEGFFLLAVYISFIALIVFIQV
jgi:cation:H+ antiporter